MFILTILIVDGVVVVTIISNVDYRPTWHIKYIVISVRHLLTLRLVTLVMTYQFSVMHTAAMLDYECLNCCRVNAHYAR